MELVKGSRVLVTVDPAFRTRGDANTVWVDYPNIVKVVSVGSRIYIDDGLISLQVQKIGADGPPPQPRGRGVRSFSLAPSPRLVDPPPPPLASALPHPSPEPPGSRLEGSTRVGAGLPGSSSLPRTPTGACSVHGPGPKVARQ